MNSAQKVNRIYSALWLTACVLLSLAGIAAFIILFAPDFNIYWFILSPIIIAMYQIPAVYLYWRWKKWRERIKDKNEEA
jgi:membrane protein YdbS with pleckstrin-like domain